MRYYPVNLNISGKKCVIIGGGKVAERKTKAILEAGGQARIISPKLTEGLRELAGQSVVSYELRPYKTGDIKKAFLAVCAADNSNVNRLAAAEAREQGALVDVVDNPQLSDFIIPAKIERGDLVITVSTSGKSPAMARRIKEEIAARYGQEYGLFLEIISRIRDELKETLPTPNDREFFWRESLNPEILSLLSEGNIEKAKHILISKISVNSYN